MSLAFAVAPCCSTCFDPDECSCSFSPASSRQFMRDRFTDGRACEAHPYSQFCMMKSCAFILLRLPLFLFFATEYLQLNASSREAILIREGQFSELCTSLDVGLVAMCNLVTLTACTHDQPAECPARLSAINKMCVVYGVCINTKCL